ncbi:rod shape-determining protein MreC [Sulfurimonas sp. HSL-1716]|uniref:rod shape-determining protein MreC n=1 Tax=Hydrocurvibacter sulfurireducens TaxID=3131937 RepID=UPI0031F77145
MNKGLLSFFIIFIALLGGAIYYTNSIQSPFISLSNSIQSAYFNTVESVFNTLDEHFYQQKHIQKLKKQLAEYDNNHLVMQQLSSELNSLYKESNSSIRTHPKVELVRAISYVKFSDINKLWLEMNDFNSSKIYGLVYKDSVAGIVISKDSKPIALLNGDIKSSYAVFVGENNAPGIAHGNNDNTIIVNFIPSWINIKVGDEVISSGLDNLFFRGLKVGKVLSIKRSQGYQSVVVDPYFKSKEPRYFYVITGVQ